MTAFIIESPNIGFIVDQSSSCGLPSYSAYIVKSQENIAIILPPE